jgi:hypothetical protein
MMRETQKLIYHGMNLNNRRDEGKIKNNINTSDDDQENQK